MGHFATITRQIMCASFGISGLALVLAAGVTLAFPDAAHAQLKKPAATPPPGTEADQKKIAAAAARRAYDSGVQAYSSGKHQAAVDQFSTALRGGGHSSAEMAKALYLRGASYKKLSKPGLAISDLTSALWLKNGLGEADQAAAKAERAEAYRMAGLAEGSAASDNSAIAAPNPSPAGTKAIAPAAVAAPAAPISAPIPSSVTQAAAPVASQHVATTSEPGQVTRQASDSQSAIDAANARRIAAQPVESNGLQAAASATLVGGGPAGLDVPAPQSLSAVAAPAAQPTPVVADSGLTQSLTPSFGTPSAPVLSAVPMEGSPQDSAAAPSSGGLPSVGGFFSNLFSGGNAPAPTAATPTAVTTASTSPATETSSWSDTTSVASGTAKAKADAKPIRTAAVAPPIPNAAPAPAVKSGKYKLHIAAVRSRAEADALAQKLVSQQSVALKSRVPVVDEAVIGSMGTFYRVRVGSYASPEEPRGVCNTLRSSGYDCLVVTN